MFVYLFTDYIYILYCWLHFEIPLTQRYTRISWAGDFVACVDYKLSLLNIFVYINVFIIPVWQPAASKRDEGCISELLKK